MSDKRKWPHADGLAVAHELVAALEPHCERVLICGSLRRRKPMVGDVEIVFVPRSMPVMQPVTDLFAPPETVHVELAAVAIAEMLALGRIAKRLSVDGSPAWGPKNKLALHVASGIPADFFATTVENWWNTVTFRTGGKVTNIAIASAANARGWTWNPYGPGFSSGGAMTGFPLQVRTMNSEREVFEFVRMAYLEPEERE